MEFRSYKHYKYDDNKIFCYYSSFGRIGSIENYQDLQRELKQLFGRFYRINSYSNYLKNKRFISHYR